MYLHKVKNKYTKRTSLLLRESYRDEQGKSQKRTLKNYGILEELEKKDKNILEKIEKEIKELKESQIKVKKFNSLHDYYEKAEYIESYYSNYGYLVYAKIFEEIGLQESMNNISKKQKQLKYNLEKTVLLQIISRLLKPGSKLKNYSNKEYFLEDFSKIKLQNIYRSMDLVYEKGEEILKKINQKISKTIVDRGYDLAFYDVTTYAFESQDADALKTFGYSKDKKFNEVQVVMGLLIDKHGIPISYELFPGDTSEFGTMKVVLEKMLKTHKIDKVIVTADKGLNSKKNLKMIKDMGFEYVVATKINGLSKDMQEKILNVEWESVKQDNKTNEITKIASIDYKNEDKENGFILEEKMVVTYSKLREHKAKKDRERTLEKIKERFGEGIINKEKLKKILKKMGKDYIKITGGDNLKIELDYEKIENKAKTDGYYAIQTSKKELSNQEICSIYHNLWKIEESFRIMKSNLEFRPVYHWKENRIKSHFFMCYLAFTIQRVLEYKLKTAKIAFTLETLINLLTNATLNVQITNIDKIYIKNKSPNDEMLEKIFNALNLKTPKKFCSEADLLAYNL